MVSGHHNLIWGVDGGTLECQVGAKDLSELDELVAALATAADEIC